MPTSNLHPPVCQPGDCLVDGGKRGNVTWLKKWKVKTREGAPDALQPRIYEAKM